MIYFPTINERYYNIQVHVLRIVEFIMVNLFCLDPHPSGTPNIFGNIDPTISTSIITLALTSSRTCSSLRCLHSCVLLRGVPTCVCRSGFQINRNGRTCNGMYNLCAVQTMTKVLVSMVKQTSF